MIDEQELTQIERLDKGDVDGLLRICNMDKDGFLDVFLDSPFAEQEGLINIVVENGLVGDTGLGQSLKSWGSLGEENRRTVASDLFEWVKTEAAVRRISEGDSTWQDVGVLLRALGSNCPSICRLAARSLKGLPQLAARQFWDAITNVLNVRPIAEDLARLRSALDASRETATILGFHHQPDCTNLPRESQAIELGLHHANEEDVAVPISTPFRRLYVIKVDPSKTHADLRGALLKISDCDHAILVSSLLSEEDSREIVSHELLDHYLKEVTNMARDERPEEINRGFVFQQLDFDPEEKALAACWAVEELPLKSGAGIVLDAGSSCLKVWEEIALRIKSRGLAYLTVYTNNLLVLDNWRARVNDLGGTSVGLLGWKLDVAHMAFLGHEEAEKRLMDPTVRCSTVFVGTSGIEFDENGRILTGFHAEGERGIKELLFKCYARNRVILATSSKIGFAGGHVIDILDVADPCAAIYLVTSEEGGRRDVEREFANAKEVIQAPLFEKTLRDKKIRFHWVILDRKTGKEKHHILMPRPSMSEETNKHPE